MLGRGGEAAVRAVLLDVVLLQLEEQLVGATELSGVLVAARHEGGELVRRGADGAVGLDAGAAQGGGQGVLLERYYLGVAARLQRN